jgi:hypothetical protein
MATSSCSTPYSLNQKEQNGPFENTLHKDYYTKKIEIIDTYSFLGSGLPMPSGRPEPPQSFADQPSSSTPSMGSKVSSIPVLASAGAVPAVALAIAVPAVALAIAVPEKAATASSVKVCTPVHSVQPCAQCGALARMQCARCKKVKYCSGNCQTTHWTVHHTTCKVNKHASTPCKDGDSCTRYPLGTCLFLHAPVPDALVVPAVIPSVWVKLAQDYKPVVVEQVQQDVPLVVPKKNKNPMNQPVLAVLSDIIKGSANLQTAPERLPETPTKMFEGHVEFLFGKAREDVCLPEEKKEEIVEDENDDVGEDMVFAQRLLKRQQKRDAGIKAVSKEEKAKAEKAENDKKALRMLALEKLQDEAEAGLRQNITYALTTIESMTSRDNIEAAEQAFQLALDKAIREFALANMCNFEAEAKPLVEQKVIALLIEEKINESCDIFTKRTGHSSEIRREELSTVSAKKRIVMAGALDDVARAVVVRLFERPCDFTSPSDVMLYGLKIDSIKEIKERKCDEHRAVLIGTEQFVALRADVDKAIETRNNNIILEFLERTNYNFAPINHACENTVEDWKLEMAQKALALDQDFCRLVINGRGYNVCVNSLQGIPCLTGCHYIHVSPDEDCSNQSKYGKCTKGGCRARHYNGFSKTDAKGWCMVAQKSILYDAVGQSHDYKCKHNCTRGFGYEVQPTSAMVEVFSAFSNGSLNPVRAYEMIVSFVNANFHHLGAYMADLGMTNRSLIERIVVKQLPSVNDVSMYANLFGILTIALRKAECKVDLPSHMGQFARGLMKPDPMAVDILTNLLSGKEFEKDTYFSSYSTGQSPYGSDLLNRTRLASFLTAVGGIKNADARKMVAYLKHSGLQVIFADWIQSFGGLDRVIPDEFKRMLEAEFSKTPEEQCADKVNAFSGYLSQIGGVANADPNILVGALKKPQISIRFDAGDLLNGKSSDYLVRSDGSIGTCVCTGVCSCRLMTETERTEHSVLVAQRIIDSNKLLSELSSQFPDGVSRLPPDQKKLLQLTAELAAISATVRYTKGKIHQVSAGNMLKRVRIESEIDAIHANMKDDALISLQKEYKKVHDTLMADIQLFLNSFQGKIHLCRTLGAYPIQRKKVSTAAEAVASGPIINKSSVVPKSAEALKAEADMNFEKSPWNKLYPSGHALNSLAKVAFDLKYSLKDFEFLPMKRFKEWVEGFMSKYSSFASFMFHRSKKYEEWLSSLRVADANDMMGRKGQHKKAKKDGDQEKLDLSDESHESQFFDLEDASQPNHSDLQSRFSCFARYLEDIEMTDDDLVFGHINLRIQTKHDSFLQGLFEEFLKLYPNVSLASPEKPDGHTFKAWLVTNSDVMVRTVAKFVTSSANVKHFTFSESIEMFKEWQHSLQLARNPMFKNARLAFMDSVTCEIEEYLNPQPTQSEALQRSFNLVSGLVACNENISFAKYASDDNVKSLFQIIQDVVEQKQESERAARRHERALVKAHAMFSSRVSDTLKHCRHPLIPQLIENREDLANDHPTWTLALTRFCIHFFDADAILCMPAAKEVIVTMKDHVAEGILFPYQQAAKREAEEIAKRETEALVAKLAAEALAKREAFEAIAKAKHDELLAAEALAKSKVTKALPVLSVKPIASKKEVVDKQPALKQPALSKAERMKLENEAKQAEKRATIERNKQTVAPLLSHEEVVVRLEKDIAQIEKAISEKKASIADKANKANKKEEKSELEQLEASLESSKDILERVKERAKGVSTPVVEHCFSAPAVSHAPKFCLKLQREINRDERELDEKKAQLQSLDFARIDSCRELLLAQAEFTLKEELGMTNDDNEVLSKEAHKQQIADTLAVAVAEVAKLEKQLEVMKSNQGIHPSEAKLSQHEMNHKLCVSASKDAETKLRLLQCKEEEAKDQLVVAKDNMTKARAELQRNECTAVAAAYKHSREVHAIYAEMHELFVGKVQAATVVLKNLKKDEKVSSELQARNVALDLEDAIARKGDRQKEKKGRNVEGRSTMREVMGGRDRD